MDGVTIDASDEAQVNFNSGCGGGRGGIDPDALQDAIDEASLQGKIKKFWSKFVGKLRTKLPPHLQSKAEPLAMIAVGGIVVLVVLIVIEQSETAKMRVRDLEDAVRLQRRQHRDMMMQFNNSKK